MQTRPPSPLAVLVGVQLPGVSDTDHAADLAELGRLVKTLGYETVATVTQRRSALATGTVLGTGKLKELANITGGSGLVSSGAAAKTSKARERWEEQDEEEAPEESPAPFDSEADDNAVEARPRATVVVVDHELSPGQLRNLEKATGAEVLDRTAVIVEIFHRHARSHEARLQVEIARLSYLAPRLRESSGGNERQQGRGAGESALELDRRKIRDRLAELREALEAIQKDHVQRRCARREQLRVALVGYTNAGKSSLMRALTGSDVLVADQLFATLDTTVRALHPESRPRVLISDTVGFIQKLPHDLVASFRSTLDEALEASLLLYVVDASDPTWENQLQVTRTVLSEIGANTVPYLLIFNKVDRLTTETREALLAAHPGALLLSALSPEDVRTLREQILRTLDAGLADTELMIPYAAQARISEIYDHTTVISETFDEHGRKMKVRGLPGVIARLTRDFAR